MSLLSACQQAATSCLQTSPSAIIGSTNQQSATLLALATEAVQEMVRRPQGGWTQMIREYDFATVAITVTGTATEGSSVLTGVSSVAGISASTFYVTGTGFPNNTTVLSIDAVALTITLSAPATTNVTGGTFVFGQSDYALPADFERIIDNTVWDRSRFWSMRGPQSPQQWQLYKSSVIGKASIQRRWRIRNIAGNEVFSIDPVPADNGSALVFEYVSNYPIKSTGGVYQSSWKADTDIFVVDEYLLGLSIKWRFLERLGVRYQEALSEYEKQVNKAMAQDGGAPILDLATSNHLTLIGPWNIPETGFGGVSN